MPDINIHTVEFNQGKTDSRTSKYAGDKSNMLPEKYLSECVVSFCLGALSEYCITGGVSPYYSIFNATF